MRQTKSFEKDPEVQRQEQTIREELIAADLPFHRQRGFSVVLT
jgi:hypothetical protein